MKAVVDSIKAVVYEIKAVVDARLRVKHVHGLRVADASIMPFVVSGNFVTGCPVKNKQRIIKFSKLRKCWYSKDNAMVFICQFEQKNRN